MSPTFLRILSASWRLERIGVENLQAAYDAGGLVITFWHGRMILPISTHAHAGYSVLVSPSDDGSLVTRLLDSFGYEIVRGSTNKNPARAARELVERLGRGGRIALTPDGPRGPRHSMNPGPAWMAKITGYPIVPMGFGCDRAWYFKSWDRFTIPRLRAHVAIVYGDLIRVAADATDDDIDGATDELRRRMIAAEERGFELVGARPDW